MKLADIMQPETFPLYSPSHPMLHPATIGIPPAEAEMVLAGFQDCSAEVIRFLVEVEGLAVDDPIVQGLKSHLQQCQMDLNYEEILRRCNIDETDPKIEHQPINVEPTSLNDSGISDSAEDSVDTDGMSTSDDISFNSDDIRVDENHGEINISNKRNISSDMLLLNNPLISKITEELLFLLDQEDCDDEEEYEEEEMIDE